MVSEKNNSLYHQPKRYHRAFAYGIILNAGFVTVEAIYGLLLHSTALLADAGHNLSDVFGLILAWGAGYLAESMPTSSRTYGLKKTTILAALFNAIILLIAVGAITIEALRKFVTPQAIEGTTMMLVAGTGVIINSITALLFLKGQKKDLNIRGAFLHMTADAGVSLGVVAAGLLINLTNWFWIDPAISIVIVIVITIGTFRLLKDSLMLSLDVVPDKIDAAEVKQYLTSVPLLKDMHHLHIWGISTSEVALTAHMVLEKFPPDNQLVETIGKKLREDFGIDHPTIQFELSSETDNCKNCG